MIPASRTIRAASSRIACARKCQRQSTGRGWVFLLAFLAWLLLIACIHDQGCAASEPFVVWIEAFWPEAQNFGISRETYDDAMRGLRPDFSLPDLDFAGGAGRDI